MKKIFIFLTFICIVSCKNDTIHYFSDDYTVVKDFEKEITPKGEIFNNDIVNWYAMNAVGNYLVLTSRDKDSIFHVYDLQGKHIFNFGVKGESPVDFINTYSMGQMENGDNNSYFWINDVGKIQLKKINITKTTNDRELNIDTIVPSKPGIIDLSVQDKLYAKIQKDTYKYLVIDIASQEITSEENMYLVEAAPYENELYRTFWITQPKGSKIVMPMMSLNQINMIDTKTNKRKSVSMYEKVKSVEESLVEEEGKKNHKYNYYGDGMATEKYIYCLYKNTEYDTDMSTKKTFEIHVFDWNLKPVKRIIVPSKVKAFSVSYDNKYLYGGNVDDGIYKYKIDL